MIRTHAERPASSERLMTARSRTLPAVPTMVAFVVGAVVLAALVAFALRPRPLTGTTPIRLADLGRRVLLIATHPDDEVLTAGGAIHKLVAAGASVKVVIATAGDGYYRAAKRIATGTPGPSDFRALGELRHRESLAAAARLGLPAADIVPLGYADGGGASLWDGSWDATHSFTSRSGSLVVPYGWAYRPSAPQCGQAVAADLAAIIRDFRPDTVIAPDPRETNLDHAAMGTFAMYAMDAAGFTGTRLTAIVHFKLFPHPSAYLPGAALAPPPHLLEAGADWLTLPITAADERVKLSALDEYRSQTALTELSWYMRAFIRTNELFCRRAASEPAASATDARPGSGALGTIAVTPPPVIPAQRPNPARVRALRMVRGPHVVWFGIVCDGTIRPDVDYRVGLRFIGGDSAPARLDVIARGGRAEALAVADDSVTPSGLAAVADGDTMWVSVPDSVFGSRTSVIAGSSSVRGTWSSRTPWVDVRL
jgi:N-acetyl-1-D-myo-inositol-2-amino-2-deoxy-alpha-D-glucopyranoside deacetylase